MGVPLTFKYWNYGLNFADIPLGLPLSMTEKPDPEAICSASCASDSAVPFDEIKASPGGVRPDDAPRHVLPAPVGGGRLELCPPDVAAELAALAAEAPEQGFAYPPDLPPHPPRAQQRLPRIAARRGGAIR